MSPRQVITVDDVEAARARGARVLAVTREAIVTSLARDEARRLEIRIEVERRDRKPLLFANWKAHGTVAEARDRARAIAAGTQRGAQEDRPEVAIFPPYPHLPIVAEVLRGSGIALGAQDVSRHPPGAKTGDVPASILTDLGCRYVLVGHSERRHELGDTLDAVREKVGRALEAGLEPVLCVGETLEERESGRTLEVVRHQLQHAASGFDAQLAPRLVVAYEPVWAIGSGLTPSASEVQACLGAIGDHLARTFGAGPAAGIQILYGGSVNPRNAAQLLALPSMDGALIGGASLDPAAFSAIVRKA